MFEFYLPLDQINLTLALAIAVLGGLWAGLWLLRSAWHTKTALTKTFDRAILQITVPKERKSEGSGGQAGQDDRLEHVREEIAITETFFSSVAGLRAQHGLGKWLTGRDDDFSFEIVVAKNLISFYVVAPKRARNFIEEQINAQYPYASIEEIPDYIFFRRKARWSVDI